MSEKTRHTKISLLPDCRKIIERWYIVGHLELQTPTYLGNGDDDPTVSLPLLTDPLTGCALLTGASLTGGLRHYLNEFTASADAAVALFGMERGGDEIDEGRQSRLIVEDALSLDEAPPQIELRDGVRIDAETRTAADQGKYETQLLAAGTTFKIGFELVITENDEKAPLLNSLGRVLHALQEGQIYLGGRKRRGYGECAVIAWDVQRYDLKTKAGLTGWLTHSHKALQPQKANVVQQLNALSDIEIGLTGIDKRQRFELDATFAIDGSVLIRSGFEAAAGPDTVHLHRRGKNGQPQPILSGTSLAGVIRAQAERIAKTVWGKDDATMAKMYQLFGFMEEGTEAEHQYASRVWVSETVIKGGLSLVQQRVAIDRFTGGALDTALFAEQPHWGGAARIKLAIHNPEPWEIGLLLLVLKDLWTSHTPIGGEASVGRGRLKGQEAKLLYRYMNNGEIQNQSWTISAAENGLSIEGGATEHLNQFVTDFVNQKEVA